MTHATCRLTAKNLDQLRNPTLGNRVWATFTFIVSLVRLVNCYYVEYHALKSRECHVASGDNFSMFLVCLMAEQKYETYVIPVGPGRARQKLGEV